MINIIPTQKSDLKNIQSLWNDGDVMKYVGFPNGLGITIDQLEKWLDRLNASSYSKHFSIYDDELGYVGETFFSMDIHNDIAALDIKLFKKARGKGIAYQALYFCIDEVFQLGLVSKVYVDPNLENKKALSLYERLGFQSKERPVFLEPSDTYFELSISRWKEIKQSN